MFEQVFKEAMKEFSQGKKQYQQTGVKNEYIQRLQKMTGYSDAEFDESLKVELC